MKNFNLYLNEYLFISFNVTIVRDEGGKQFYILTYNLLSDPTLSDVPVDKITVYTNLKADSYEGIREHIEKILASKLYYRQFVILNGQVVNIGSLSDSPEEVLSAYDNPTDFTWKPFLNHDRINQGTIDDVREYLRNTNGELSN